MYDSLPASRERAQGMLRLSPHRISIVQVCVDHRFAPALVPCCKTSWEDVEKEALEPRLPKPGIGAVLLPEIQLGSTHCLQRKVQ